MAALLLLSGLAHAAQQDAAGGGTPDGAADATPFEAAIQPTTAGQPAPPLPRFTVGWYCPVPQANPLPDLLGFGLGVLLIWGMAARRKAREARGA